MRTRLVLASVAVFVVATAGPATAGHAKASDQASCVGQFASTLGPAGVAGVVISNGAQVFQPFGRNVVSQQARAPRGQCPFDPHAFLP